MGRWHYFIEELVIICVQHDLTLARRATGFFPGQSLLRRSSPERRGVVQGKEYVCVCPCGSVANFKIDLFKINLLYALFFLNQQS
jgi:hypothetical protein